MTTFRSRQFKKEDYPKLLQTEPAFEDFLSALNQANKLLESILNGGVLFSDNAQAKWKTLEVLANGSVPLWPATRFAHGLSGAPKAVMLASALDITTPQRPVPASLSQPAWTAPDATSVQVTDLVGLTASKRYRLTFLVIAG
jgi:hypothetical protein